MKGLYGVSKGFLKGFIEDLQALLYELYRKGLQAADMGFIEGL